MPTGTIKRVFKDRGFGFIRTSDGQEIFFHRSGLRSAVSSLSQRGMQWNLRWNPALRDLEL
jgi:cold shock CspA family protein